jgi:FkbM family methyltransferase
MVDLSLPHAPASAIRGLSWGAYRPGFLGGVLVSLSRYTPLGRGSMRRVLFNWFSRLHSGPADVHVHGRPVRLYPAHNNSERKALMCPDRHDRVERALLRATVRKPAAVFVDIGANAGIYSLDAAMEAGAGSRIIAIEPNPELLGRLRFNEGLARSTGRILSSVTIETCPVAVSDADGDAFLSDAENEGSRALTREGNRRVQTRTLTGLLSELGIHAIDILKIDVEGHEDSALLPFLADAPDNLLPAVMIIEHLQRDRWSRDVLVGCDARGYVVQSRTNNNTILAREPLPNPPAL